jgi:hypothetical protein
MLGDDKNNQRAIAKPAAEHTVKETPKVVRGVLLFPKVPFT